MAVEFTSQQLAGAGNVGAGIAGAFEGFAGFGAASSLDRSAKSTRLAGDISAASSSIELAAAERDLTKVIGGQQADIAGAGFLASGTALELLASSRAEGAIQNALLKNQAAIDALGFEDQAKAAKARAKAQRISSAGKILGNIVTIGLGLLMLFSDRRLKHNIQHVGVDSEGIKLYEFSYHGSDVRYKGYMADELPKGAVVDPTGFKSVDIDHRAVRLDG